MSTRRKIVIRDKEKSWLMPLLLLLVAVAIVAGLILAQLTNHIDLFSLGQDSTAPVVSFANPTATVEPTTTPDWQATAIAAQTEAANARATNAAIPPSQTPAPTPTLAPTATVAPSATPNGLIPVATAQASIIAGQAAQITALSQPTSTPKPTVTATPAPTSTPAPGTQIKHGQKNVAVTWRQVPSIPKEANALQGTTLTTGVWVLNPTTHEVKLTAPDGTFGISIEGEGQPLFASWEGNTVTLTFPETQGQPTAQAGPMTPIAGTPVSVVIWVS